jgi:hypothetical protein
MIKTYRCVSVGFHITGRRLLVFLLGQTKEQESDNRGDGTVEKKYYYYAIKY